MKNRLAPAKLNLFLHVLGQRADGFHELQTLFQLLDFGDNLSFEITLDGRVERSENPGLPEDDLTILAARALKNYSHCELGVKISLDKRIPLGAGLGGGSSDAGTTLVALNKLWNLGLSRQCLSEIGLGLGADIPFFVGGHSAWAEGVGELLTPAQLPDRHYCVVWPQVKVPTAAIFSDPELTRNTPPIRIPSPTHADWRNDLEPVTRKRFPEVGQCLEWLSQFGVAQMSGSGSAVFLITESDQSGEEIIKQLPAFLSGLVARGINHNPAFFEEPSGV